MISSLIGNRKLQSSDQFFNDEFIKQSMSLMLPKFNQVDKKDIYILQYISFRGKRSCDFIFKYKDIYIPLSINFNEFFELKYSVRICFDKGALSSNFFEVDKIDNYNIDQFNDFFENSQWPNVWTPFQKMLADFYHSNGQSIIHKQVVSLKYNQMNEADKIQLSLPHVLFDSYSRYEANGNSVFMNIHGESLDDDHYVTLKTTQGETSIKIPTDYMLEKSYSMDPLSIFKSCVLKLHTIIDDNVMADFNDYFDAVKYYHTHQDFFKKLGEMIKI